MTTKKNEEHIELKATTGGLSFLRWLIPLVLTGSLLGGSGVIAKDLSDMNSRIQRIEQKVSDNTVDINGQKIRLSEYDARFVELQTDVRETREATQKILIILTKRNPD